MNRLEKVCRYLWSNHVTPRALRGVIIACVLGILYAFFFGDIVLYIIMTSIIILTLLSYWYLLDKEEDASKGKPTNPPNTRNGTQSEIG